MVNNAILELMKQRAEEFFQEKLRRLAEKEGSVEKRMHTRPDHSSALVDGKIKSIYITGVCGKATSSLAGLFAEAGYDVYGSDLDFYPPASTLIEHLGIHFYEGFSADHVKGKDLVVVANVFGPDNVEVAYARENNMLQMSLPEATAQFFIKDNRSIVICGTHGKTTTTGMAAHVFIKAKRHPGFLVGGTAVPTDGGIQETSFAVPVSDTKHFIIEGDEYDTAYFDKSPKFLHYKPTIAVVTSLEYDHADIYADYKEYKESFILLAEEMNKDGLLVLNGDSDEVRSLAAHTEATVLYYGVNEGCDVTARNVSIDENGQHFELIFKGQSMGHFDIGLYGRYNLANALAVCTVALNEKLSTGEIQEGLKTYKGMKRRQEILAVVDGITVIDDFAHHPTAVRETLAGIREHFPTRRIIALFEPRSNTSRKKMFEHDYGQAFGVADALYLSMPTLRENDNPADFIDGNTVIAEAKAQSVAKNKDFSGFCVASGDEALALMVPTLKSGDVVVIMSNGSFDGVHEKLIQALKEL